MKKFLYRVSCFFLGHSYITKDFKMTVNRKRVFIKQCIICGKLKEGE